MFSKKDSAAPIDNMLAFPLIGHQSIVPHQTGDAVWVAERKEWLLAKYEQRGHSAEGKVEEWIQRFPS